MVSSAQFLRLYAKTEKFKNLFKIYWNISILYEVLGSSMNIFRKLRAIITITGFGVRTSYQRHSSDFSSGNILWGCPRRKSWGWAPGTPTSDPMDPRTPIIFEKLEKFYQKIGKCILAYFSNNFKPCVNFSHALTENTNCLENTEKVLKTFDENSIETLNFLKSWC